MIDFINALKQNIKGEVTPLAKERADVCAGCEFKKKAVYAGFVKGLIKEIDGYVCAKCECPLSTKIFAEKKENICDKWLR